MKKAALFCLMMLLSTSVLAQAAGAPPAPTVIAADIPLLESLAAASQLRGNDLPGKRLLEGGVF